MKPPAPSCPVYDFLSHEEAVTFLQHSSKAMGHVTAAVYSPRYRDSRAVVDHVAFRLGFFAEERGDFTKMASPHLTVVALPDDRQDYLCGVRVDLVVLVGYADFPFTVV